MTDNQQTTDQYIARQKEIDDLELSLHNDLEKQFVGKYLKVIKEYKWPKTHPVSGRVYKIDRAFVGHNGVVLCIEEYNGFQVNFCDCEVLENYEPKPKKEKKPDDHIWICNIPKIHVCMKCGYVKKSSDRSYPTCAEVMAKKERSNAKR